MADLDTSFYPKAESNSLVQGIGQAIAARNAIQQNQLLQTANQREKVGLSQDQIALAHKGYDGLSDMLGSLAQDPRISTDQGPSIVQQYAQNAVKQGFLSPDQAQTALSTMPSDPTQIPQWLQTINTQHLDSQSRFSAIYGSPGTINNGSQVLPVTTSPITGIRPIGAPITQTLGPSERADLIKTTNDQGQTVITPKANILTQAGMNPLTAVPQSAPTGAANQLMAPSGSVVASPAAGEVEAQTRQAAASSDKYSADQQREANFQSDMLPLQKAYNGLKALGTTGTGPGTEQINDVKSFLVSQGLIGPNDDVKSFDEVRKYTSQIARSAGDVGSDNRLAAAFSANPSVNISNAAAQDVLKSMISLRKLQNAQVSAFTASGQSPSQYQKWASQWSKTQDPVAYGFDMMEPAERAKYIQSLSAPDKAKFVASLKTAVGLGLVQRPTAGSQ